MSSKLPPISPPPITVPTGRPSTLTVDPKTLKSNRTKLVPIETTQTTQTTSKIFNPLLDRSKLERPKTASKSGKRQPYTYTSGKGGRKTRKAKKSKNIRNNRNSKSKRKTRKK